jgi:hypothetical protein
MLTGSMVMSDGQSRSLAERWNRRKWSLTRAPNQFLRVHDSLNGVSCVSNTNCTAVGEYAGPISILFGVECCGLLMAHWDGAKWSTRLLPAAPGSSEVLHAVSCKSASACIAVGQTGTNRTAYGLIMRWNGHSWRRQPNPADSEHGADLTGVSCGSATSCTAVGITGGTTPGGTGPTRPIIEHWDGARWIKQQPPTPAGSVERLPLRDLVPLHDSLRCRRRQ